MQNLFQRFQKIRISEISSGLSDSYPEKDENSWKRDRDFRFFGPIRDGLIKSEILSFEPYFPKITFSGWWLRPISGKLIHFFEISIFQSMAHHRKIEISKKKLDDFFRKRSEYPSEKCNFEKIFGIVFLEIGSEIVTFWI